MLKNKKYLEYGKIAKDTVSKFYWSNIIEKYKNIFNEDCLRWRFTYSVVLMYNNKLAIFLIITSVFFGTVMLSFLKVAQEDVNVYVAGFFRFFLGLVIILPYIIKKKDAVLKTTHLKQHFLRAILGLPAMLLYFSALVLLPI